MHVCSRIVKVVSTNSVVIISSKDRDTLASIKWYQFSFIACIVELSVASSCQLLVLVSSSFRVSSSVHISHVAAASLSLPPSTIPSINFHHVLRTVHCHNHSLGHSHLRLIQSASYLVCLGKREKKREKKTRKKREKKLERKKGEKEKKV